jgi:Na+-transporting methylmalonyl-CoA/oxaloacetate decarboxylase beta subunit
MIGRIVMVLVAAFMIWLGVTLLIDPGLMVPSATTEPGEAGAVPDTALALIARLSSAGLLFFFAATLVRIAWKKHRQGHQTPPGSQKD